MTWEFSSERGQMEAVTSDLLLTVGQHPNGKFRFAWYWGSDDGGWSQLGWQDFAGGMTEVFSEVEQQVNEWLNPAEYTARAG